MEGICSVMNLAELRARPVLWLLAFRHGLGDDLFVG